MAKYGISTIAPIIRYHRPLKKPKFPGAAGA
jgi:hypothetical protein